MHISWFMSIYLTVFLTLERFHKICLNNKAKKQGTGNRIRLYLFLMFVLIVMFNITKFMEYTWNEKTVRTDYDSDDSTWNILANKYAYLMNNNGHLDFKENYPEFALLGADDSKS